MGPGVVSTTRIVIVDDQENVRAGFRLVLDSQPDMSVVGEAADGAAALEVVRRLRPDVVLADVRMPGVDGLELTRRLAGTGPRVIVVTTFDHDEYVTGALRDGACGFLLKRSGPTLLIEAVRAAMAGDTLISPQVTVRLLRRMPSLSAVPVGNAPLTARELEIAVAVAQGGTNAGIARELGLSAGTVKTHVAHIQAKLGVRNRVGIAAWAWAAGRVPK
ncbi:DNA-binding response regulator [Virgisporangium aliadipatigenens]|uniref:DNA-binding response regulator n=1 Tax=Virgisporangium aliadipatigenens TaxID=741659 RepID=A0A8J3YFP6_9ACTN|nr:DNA-binding response regulator [Virgisporangium aliadipatigenens]